MIIAVDFDGILCYDAFPSIGKPNTSMIAVVKLLIDQGHEVVLWTSRNGQELTDAVNWCEKQGIRFCNVNAPAPSNAALYGNKYPTESRKIYADIYIDDRSAGFEFDRTVQFLQEVIEKWQEENLQS